MNIPSVSQCAIGVGQGGELCDLDQAYNVIYLEFKSIFLAALWEIRIMVSRVEKA